VLARRAALAPDKPSVSPIRVPQHPDQHRPECPVLLAVDQELGEGTGLRVAPELSYPVGSLKVGKHQDVEQFGTGSRTEGVETCPPKVLISSVVQALTVWLRR
jgi:hypothetical protein